MKLYINTAIQDLCKFATCYSKIHDTCMWNIIQGKNNETPCESTIITTGIGNDVIGYANEIHCDNGNKYSNEKQKEIVESVNFVVQNCNLDIYI